MACDLHLASICSEGDFYFRLYQWKPYCLSLGYNQSDSVINFNALEQAGFDAVRRPTGGRAILHAQELTYSVVTKAGRFFTPQELYRRINSALKAGLGLYDNLLSSAELEQEQPDFRKFYETQSSIVCFASTAKNELKHSHKKLVGSAQRKLGETLLQHGSILCSPAHKQITELLNLEESLLHQMNTELNEKTTDILSITGKDVDYQKLGSCILQGMQTEFDGSFLAVQETLVFNEDDFLSSYTDIKLENNQIQ